MEPNNHYVCEEVDFFSKTCTSKRLYGFFYKRYMYCMLFNDSCIAALCFFLFYFFCSGIQFYLLLSPYPCFISFFIWIYMF